MAFNNINTPVTSERFISRVRELESLRTYERTLDLECLSPSDRITDSLVFHPIGIS